MFASVGLPGLSGFVGEFLTLLGTFVAIPAAAVVATFVMIFAAGYLLWMFQRVAFGELSDFLKGLGHHLTDMRPVEALTLVPLGVLVVVFGLWPGLILDLIAGSVATALDAVETGRARRPRPVAVGGPPMTFNDIVTLAPFVAAILLVRGDPDRRLRLPRPARAGAGHDVRGPRADRGPRRDHRPDRAAEAFPSGDQRRLHRRPADDVPGPAVHLDRRADDGVRARTTSRRAACPVPEFAATLVFAMSGAMLLAASGDLLVLFLGLELMVLPGYVLAGYHKTDGYSTEGAIKYFLLGSFSSAIFLFGLAFVWGTTGETNIEAVAGEPRPDRGRAPRR